MFKMKRKSADPKPQTDKRAEAAYVRDPWADHPMHCKCYFHR